MQYQRPFDGLLKCQLKRDDTRAETRFRLWAKRTSPFKSAGASVQSTTGSRVVRISGSNAGYTIFWGSVKGTGYPLYLPVSPSLPQPCVTVCHHISTWVYGPNTLYVPTIRKQSSTLNSMTDDFTVVWDVEDPVSTRSLCGICKCDYANEHVIYIYIYIFVVPCIVILGWRNPICNSMQIFIYC